MIGPASLTHASDQTSTLPTAPGTENVLQGVCLVVEDNALIAMESEAQLIDFGAQSVEIAATVEQALVLLAGRSYEFALLDVNLGKETSRLVAEALAAAAIPHAFVTGYGDLAWNPPGDVRAPVLRKPLDSLALRHAIVRARSLAQSEPHSGKAGSSTRDGEAPFLLSVTQDGSPKAP